MDIIPDHDPDDAALVRLLLNIIGGGGNGYLHIETRPDHPDLCPGDCVVYVDPSRPEDEQRTMLRDALADVLVANLVYDGEQTPQPRERMRLVAGGAR